MQIVEILVTIIFQNGERVQGSISAEGDSRWGAPQPYLAACVEPMEAMRDSVCEYFDCIDGEA